MDNQKIEEKKDQQIAVGRTLKEGEKFNKDFQINASKEGIRDMMANRLPAKMKSDLQDGKMNEEQIKKALEETGVVQKEGVDNKNEQLYAYTQAAFEEADAEKARADAEFKNVLPAEKGGWKERKEEKKAIEDLRKSTNANADINTIREKKDLEFYAKFRNDFIKRKRKYIAPLLGSPKYEVSAATVKDGLLPFMHVYKRKWGGFSTKSLDGVYDARSENKQLFRNYYNKGTISDWFADKLYKGLNLIHSVGHFFGADARMERSLRNNTLDKCLFMLLNHPITVDMLTDKYYASHAIEFEAHLDRIRAFEVLKNDNLESWWNQLQPPEIRDVADALIKDMERPLATFIETHKRLHGLESDTHDEQIDPNDTYKVKHKVIKDDEGLAQVPKREDFETEELYNAAYKEYRENLDKQKALDVQANIKESWKSIREQQLKAQEKMGSIINAQYDKLLKNVEDDAKKARRKRLNNAKKKKTTLDEVVFTYDVSGAIGRSVAEVQRKISENESAYHVLGMEINTLFEKYYRLNIVLDELKGREAVLSKEKELLKKSKIEDGVMKGLFNAQRRVELNRNQKKQETIRERIAAYKNVLDFLTNKCEGVLTDDAKALLKTERMPYIEHFPQWKKNYSVLQKDGFGKEGEMNDAEMADHFWQMRMITSTNITLQERLKKDPGMEGYDALKISSKNFSNYNITDFSKLSDKDAVKWYKEIKCLTEFAKDFAKMKEADKLKKFPTPEERADAEARAWCFNTYGPKWLRYFERAVNPKYYLPLTTLEDGKLNAEKLQKAHDNLVKKYPAGIGLLANEDEKQIQELIQEIKNQLDIRHTDNELDSFSEAAYQNKLSEYKDKAQWRKIRYENNAFADTTVVDIQKAVNSISVEEHRIKGRFIDAQNDAKKVIKLKRHAEEVKEKDPAKYEQLSAEAEELENKTQTYVNEKISAFLDIKLDTGVLELNNFHNNFVKYFSIAKRYREMESLMKDENLKSYVATYPELQPLLDLRMNKDGVFAALDAAVTQYMESYGFRNDLSGEFKEGLGEKDLCKEIPDIVKMEDAERKAEWERRFGQKLKDAEKSLKDVQDRVAKLNSAEEQKASEELFKMLYKNDKIKGENWYKWREELVKVSKKEKWSGGLAKAAGMQALIKAEASRRLAAGPAGLNDFFDYRLRINRSKDFVNQIREMNFKLDKEAAEQAIDTSDAVMEVEALQFRVLDIETDSLLQEAVAKWNEEYEKEAEKKAEEAKSEVEKEADKKAKEAKTEEEKKAEEEKKQEERIRTNMNDVRSFRMLLQDVMVQQNGLRINMNTNKARENNVSVVRDYLNGKKDRFLQQAAREVLKFELKQEHFEYKTIKDNFKMLYKNALRMEAFTKLYERERKFFDEGGDFTPEEREELKWRFSKLSGGAYVAYAKMLRAYVHSQGVDDDGRLWMGVDDKERAEKIRLDASMTENWYSHPIERFIRFCTGSYRHNKNLKYKIEENKQQSEDMFEQAHEDALMPFKEREAAAVLRQVNADYKYAITAEMDQQLSIAAKGLIPDDQYANIRYLFKPIKQNPVNEDEKTNNELNEDVNSIRKDELLLVCTAYHRGPGMIPANAAKTKKDDQKTNAKAVCAAPNGVSYYRGVTNLINFFGPMAGDINKIMNRVKDMQFNNEEDVRKNLTPELYTDFKKLNAYLNLLKPNIKMWELNNDGLRSCWDGICQTNKRCAAKGKKEQYELPRRAKDYVLNLLDVVPMAMDTQLTHRLENFSKIMDIYAKYVGVDSEGNLVREDVIEKVGSAGNDVYKLEIIEEYKRKRKEYFSAVLQVMNTEKVGPSVLEFGTSKEKKNYLKKQAAEEAEKKKK